MAGNRPHFQCLKSILATSLIAPGILIFGAHITAAADTLSRTVGWNTADAQLLGPVALLALGVPHALQDFLQSWNHVLLSLWPLLFVVAGAVLLRFDFEGAAEKTEEEKTEEYVGEHVDFAFRRSTLQ